MSKYKPSPMYVTGQQIKSPLPFATDEQYEKYLNLLSERGISSSSVNGKFTQEQLEVAQEAFNQCPPGYTCAKKKKTGYDTPIINPAPGFNPLNDLNAVKNSDGTYTGSKRYTYSNGKYITTYGNTSHAGMPHMGGFRFMPTTFRSAQRKTVSPEQYGYDNTISGDRYVSTTHQRVTGGAIIPLAKPLTTVERGARVLRSVDINVDGRSEIIQNLGGLNQTNRNYSPVNVSSTANINGNNIWNVGNQSPSDGAIVNPGNTYDASSDLVSGPTGIAPGTSIVTGGQDIVFDPDTIRYNTYPLINIVPKTMDTNGNYVPAGPAITVPISQPTPEFTINQYDALALDEGEELILNGKKIVIGGKGIAQIKSQINCANVGLTATFNQSSLNTGSTTVNGRTYDTLVIQSCNNQPWTVANGCGKGRLRQIADFHINRGFEQSRDKTTTTSDVPIYGSTSITTKPSVRKAGSGLDTSYAYTDIETDQSGTSVFYRYDYDKTRKEYIEIERGVKQQSYSFNTPAIVPMESEAELRRFTTGGSGYRVGDRLRIVGGVPAKNTFGPLTKICIDSAGAGYRAIEDIEIIINPDGLKPGFGAQAVVTALDENGGIAEIEVVNYGSGYDIDNPPDVMVVDASLNPNIVTVRAAWADEATYPTGTYFELIEEQDVKDINGNIIAREQNRRYLRNIGPAVTMGTRVVSDGNTGAYNLDTNSFTYTAHRAMIPYTGLTNATALGAYIRPNSEVEITHYPTSDRIDSEVLEVETVAGGISKTNYSPKLDSIFKSRPNDSYAIYNLDTEMYVGEFTGIPEAVIENEIVKFHFPVTLNTAKKYVICFSKTKRYWIPSPINPDGSTPDSIVTSTYFIIEDSEIRTESDVGELFPAGAPITVVASKPWYKDAITSLSIVPDPRVERIDAKLSSIVGIHPNADNPTLNNPQMLDGFHSLAGPLRVAKFIVTSIDEFGGITGLRCIDRGLYVELPQDLTFGIPLEYDYHIMAGSPATIGGAGTPDSSGINYTGALGMVDPARDNLPYHAHPSLDMDQRNPEYNVSPFRNGRHPDWSGYAEFKWNPDGTVVEDGETITGIFERFYGTPGAYDPGTWVLIDSFNVATAAGRDQGVADNIEYKQKDLADALRQGRLMKKDYDIDLDGKSFFYGSQEELMAGGTGARLFITGQEVPTCTEKGRAKEKLGLPDVVSEINAPVSIARAINNAIRDAGYDPQDLSFSVTPIGDIGVIEMDSNFPGIEITSPTPGFLDKLGLPEGDFNLGMLCIEATLNDPTITDEEAAAQVDQMYASGRFGTFSAQEEAARIGVDPKLVDPAYVISLLCVDRMGVQPIPRNPMLTPLNDNNSIFHDGESNRIIELFKYDITNIFGDAVELAGDSQKQNTQVNIFESKRFNELNDIERLPTVEGTVPALAKEANAWVDDFFGTGWAYLENGVLKARQSRMVDTNNVVKTIVYDDATGDRVHDVEFWDPFKGVLPGFVRNEIHFISQADPVSYNSARSMFGRQNVGKVWWDTSTVAYQWYEQGTDEERAENWGKAFPGSSITVCEWVESKALPQNWTGNGIPRWRDRYVTERHKDPVSGEYTQYYYYWVQNRSVVDDPIQERLGRKMDTLTIARYISDPLGYGLNTISFISDKSFVLGNANQVIDDNDNNLQITFRKNFNLDGIKHTAWKLMREGDDTNEVPDHISDKLIDSLTGYNAIGQAVPDTRLSEVERYGIAFRPRQTMFKNIKEARRVMVSTLNEMLAELKLNTQHPGWDNTLPQVKKYIETVNWYAVDRVDPRQNQKIRYNDSYKPVFNVNSVSELDRLTGLPDGTVVQVKSSQNDTSQLWLFRSNTSEFKQISVKDDTIRLKSTLYTDDTSPEMANELRLLLNALRNDVFAGTELWNLFFFQMLKYAYMEQKQLNWAFKTTYLYVEKTEEDLVQFTGFKPDNFAKVLAYMNEVKPFNAKIREYKDGKTAPVEIIGRNSISDFDKPPYVDPVTNSVRILDELDADDYAIMANDHRYSNYITIQDKSQDPIRKIKSKIVFDRTNYHLTEWAWDKTAEPLEMSIAKNISYLAMASNEEVMANDTMRAADRVFKFDLETRATFIAEMNLYFGNDSAYRDPAIVGDPEVVYQMVLDGQLKNTLALVKTKVGGDFRGEELDAKRFAKFIDEVEYVNSVITEFGYDTEPFDGNSDNDWTEYTYTHPTDEWRSYTVIGIGDTPWDSVKQLVNYEGVFEGNVTLRRNDETYEGFDGVTFQRVLYGENRPEELALFDPLESVIIDVHTNSYSLGSTNELVAPNAANVSYRTHLSLFGNTDHFRMLTRNRTTLSKDLFSYDDSITLTNVSMFPDVTQYEKGYIWVGDEKIIFERINGTVLTELQRGVHGTTIQDWPAGTEVYVALESEQFNNLDPRQTIWLDTNAVSLADRANVESSSNMTIMKFLHEYSAPSEPEPVYSLTVDNATPNEGDTITATFTTDQPDGPYYWFVQHVSTNNDDFGTVPPTYGNPQEFMVTNGEGTFQFTMSEDLSTEGTEQFSLHVSTATPATPATNAATVMITVSDTSVELFTLTVNTTTPEEGTLSQFMFTSNNVNNPSTFYWWIEHGTTDDADFTVAPPSNAARESFTLTNGSHQFGVIIDNDSLTEGVETYNIKVSDSPTGAAIVESQVAIEIQDTSVEIVVLDAGEDQFVIGTDTASLNGFYSSDLTGKTVTWEQISGDEIVIIDNASALSSFFTVPSGLLESTLIMRLYINKGLPDEIYDDVTYYAQAFSGTTPPSSEIGNSGTGLSVNPSVGE